MDLRCHVPQHQDGADRCILVRQCQIKNKCNINVKLGTRKQLLGRFERSLNLAMRYFGAPSRRWFAIRQLR